MLALTQLRYLMYIRKSAFKEWGMRLLVEQLYDVDSQICQCAVMAIDEACDQPECLDSLIKLKPVLEHLGEMARPIVIRFVLFADGRLLSTQQGFQSILGSDFINDEIEIWLEVLNMR